MLNGQALALVEQMTVLGVVLTNDLSWFAHASYIQGKLSGRLGALRDVLAHHLTSELGYNSSMPLLNRCFCTVCQYGETAVSHVSMSLIGY